MQQDSLIPDAPFRAGVTSKYKLLIEEVIPKYGNYEYVLVDADGKEYQAVAKEHYSKGEFLRCMVSFDVVRAQLVVSGTTICKKQDLTTPIVDKKEPKLQSLAEKPNPLLHPQGLPVSVSPPKPKPLILQEDPSVAEKTGLYRLKVVTTQTWERYSGQRHLYSLSDGSGHKYYAVSNKSYSIGDFAVCTIEVLKERKGNYYFSAFFEDVSSKPVGLVDGDIIPRHYFLASPIKTRRPNLNRPTKPKEKASKPATVQVLLNKYVKRERYTFIATDERDANGYQLVEDESGNLHLLTGTTQRYAKGEKIRCTVKGFGQKPVGSIKGPYLVLTEPRKIVIERITVSVPYVKPPEKWGSEVKDLGKHKCGKPFTCSCCGRNFPANAGVRVDLKDIYFCNSCARKIYEPTGRGNHHIFISTPMGNKR